MMEAKKLKVGIAGFGVVGKKRKLCADLNPHLEVVAVCDKNFFKSGVTPDNVKGFTNYEELLREDLDVLFVCMTNEIAPTVVMAALRRGIHVFCEKPPGREVADLLEVMEVEKEANGPKLMYGFNHRYHYSVQKALEVIQSGQLGSVINLRGVYGKSKFVAFNQSDWRTDRKIAGGGILLDQGIHLVDLMRLFAGEFTSVQSIVSNRHWELEVEDNAYAIMTTKAGIVGMLHSSATEWRHKFRLEITCEDGALILSGILSGTKSYGEETLTIVQVDHLNGTGNPSETTTQFDTDPSWEAEIDAFTNSVLADSPIKSGSSSDALKTMQLVYKIYFADEVWRDKFNIRDPDRGLK